MTSVQHNEADCQAVVTFKSNDGEFFNHEHSNNNLFNDGGTGLPNLPLFFCFFVTS